MLYFGLILVLVIVGGVTLFVQRSAAYYGKIYSDAHYAEIGKWVHSVLTLGPIIEANADTVLQSSAGCGLSFTRDIGEKDTLHFAISQIGHPTTHAVAGRIAFLVLQILNRNHAEARFFFTESTVHHMVYAKEAGGEWQANEVAFAVGEMKRYQPLPFEFETVEPAA